MRRVRSQILKLLFLLIGLYTFFVYFSFKTQTQSQTDLLADRQQQQQKDLVKSGGDPPIVKGNHDVLKVVKAKPVNHESDHGEQIEEPIKVSLFHLISYKKFIRDWLLG